MNIHEFIRKHELIVDGRLVHNESYANAERLIYQDYILDIYLSTEHLVLKMNGDPLTMYHGYNAVQMWNNKIVKAIEKYNNLRLLANKL